MRAIASASSFNGKIISGGTDAWSRIPIRCMTYDNGKPSGEAPRALLRLYFGDVDGKLCDIEFAHNYILRNKMPCNNIVMQQRAWCKHNYGSACDCGMVGMEDGDAVYDATRFALARLVMMCAQHGGKGEAAFVARVAMAAYLPITRIYDNGGTVATMKEAAALVDIDKTESAFYLPNIRHILLNVELWAAGPVYKTGTVECMVAHLLGKALPIRCHFRNMRKITTKYCLKDKNKFDKLMHSVLRCMLLGLFPDSEAPPSFETIRSMDRLTTPASVPVDDMGKFACKYDYLVFHATKEFLVLLVDGMPPLKKLLQLTYRWDVFVRQVKTSTAAIRKTILAYPNATSGDLTALDTYAKHLNKSHIKNLYNVRKKMPEEMIRDSMKGNFEAVPMTLDDPYMFEPFDIGTAAWRMTKVYGIPDDIAAVVSNAVYYYFATGNEMSSLGDILCAPDMEVDTCRRLSRYIRDVTASRMFSFVSLGEKTKQRQIDALKERYCIMHQVTDEEVIALSEFPFCLSCNTWKAPVPTLKKLDINVAFSYMGVQNIVVSGETMQTSCGACYADSNMFSFPLVGFAVRVNRDVFVICTGCGSVTIMNALNVVDGLHLCPACATKLVEAEETVKRMADVCVVPGCMYQQPKETSQTFTVTDDVDYDGEVHMYGVCATHKTHVTNAIKETRLRSGIQAYVEKKLSDEKRRASSKPAPAHKRGRTASIKTVMSRFRQGKSIIVGANNPRDEDE